MITESPDGTIRYTDASGKQVALSIFDDASRYAAASKRISEQKDGNSANQTAANNYNGYVTQLQTSIDDGEPNFAGQPIAQAVANLGGVGVPLMQVWPDDPALPMHTAPFPAGVLLTLRPAPPSSGAQVLGPDSASRSATPLDPAMAARFDDLSAKLGKLYATLLTVPGVRP